MGNKPWNRFGGDDADDVKNPAVCHFLREWSDSVAGIEPYIYDYIFPTTPPPTPSPTPSPRMDALAKLNKLYDNNGRRKLSTTVWVSNEFPRMNVDKWDISRFETVEDKIRRDKILTNYLIDRGGNKLHESVLNLLEPGGILTLQPEYYMHHCDKYVNNPTVNEKFLSGEHDLISG